MNLYDSSNEEKIYEFILTALELVIWGDGLGSSESKLSPSESDSLLVDGRDV